MSKAKDLHQKWMKNAEYRKAHEALTPEFELARAELLKVNVGEDSPVDQCSNTSLEMLLEEAARTGEPTEMTAKDWDDIEREGLAILRSREGKQVRRKQSASDERR